MRPHEGLEGRKDHQLPEEHRGVEIAPCRPNDPDGALEQHQKIERHGLATGAPWCRGVPGPPAAAV